MEFYVIPPLSKLELMNKGNRIFVLTQLWKKSEEYRNFILDQKAQGKWITLDNGAGDHDTTTTQEELLMIVKELLPNEVIPIDVLFDYEATVYNLDRFVELMRGEDLLDKVEIFGCPQGRNKEEWLKSYRYMLKHPFVKTIGLSKITVPYVYDTGKDDKGIMEGRHLCFEELKELDLLQKPIHCLGAGDPREFLKYINEPLMRSTDSCFTVWSAMNGIDWHEGEFLRIPTPREYFDLEITDKEVELAVFNINFLKKVLNAV